MKIGDTVKIRVETQFGEIDVTFTVIAILPEGYYGLIAQHRVAIGKPYEGEEGRYWILSESTDLMPMILTVDLNKHHEEI